MKKLLLVVLGLVATQTFAQFTLDGEFRPRTEFRNGYKTLNPSDVDPALFTSQRTRLNTKFESEKYSFFVSIQDVRVWGDVSQLNVDSSLPKLKKEEILKKKKSLKKYLNASIANVLFGDIGFYRIMHQDDKMLQKVLELESKEE